MVEYSNFNHVEEHLYILCIETFHEGIKFLLAVLDIVPFSTKSSIHNKVSKEDDVYMRGRGCMSMLSAHEVAQSFTSSFPYFVRIMKSFNVSGSYTLVGCFHFFFFN